MKFLLAALFFTAVSQCQGQPNQQPSSSPTVSASSTPSSSATPTVTPTASSASQKVRYLIGSEFVNAIVSDPIASAALDGSAPIINIATIGKEGVPAVYPSVPPSIPTTWNAVFVYRFASEAQMELDVPNLPSWISVVMYDNETSLMTPMTPTDEQNDPATYVAKAAALAHQYGKQFIQSAAIRQYNAQQPKQNEAVLATSTAWDYYSIQSQMGENSLSGFTHEINALETAISTVNPKVQYIVGIGDIAGGTLVAPDQIAVAAHAAPPNSIFWLNFGVHAGPACKDTTVCPIPSRPDLLVQLIKDMAQ